MKAHTFGILGTALLGLGAATAHGAKVSIDFFYDNLEPYGDWVDAGDYGYAWHPRDVGEDWRPYTVGSWAYTDAGWTWVSDEPFGWATYHYGRWVDLDTVGWVWVPDTEWGPAWVSWRKSDEYVGWAPLPPEARFEARVGLAGWVDAYFDIGPRYYSFVPVRELGAPHLRTMIIEPRRNVTIINETRNITRITYEHNVVFDGGPQFEAVARVSAQPIRRLRLERRSDFESRGPGRGERFAAEVSGQTLRVAAPQIEADRGAAPKKVAQKIQKVEVNRGWQNAGDPQQVKALRAKIASEEKPPAALPPNPHLPGSEQPPVAEGPGRNSRGTAEQPSHQKPPAGADEPGKSRTGATEPNAPDHPQAEKRTGEEKPPQKEAETPSLRQGQPEARRPGHAGEKREQIGEGPGQHRTPGQAEKPNTPPKTEKPDAENPPDETNQANPRHRRVPENRPDTKGKEDAGRTPPKDIPRPNERKADRDGGKNGPDESAMPKKPSAREGQEPRETPGERESKKPKQPAAREKGAQPENAPKANDADEHGRGKKPEAGPRGEERGDKKDKKDKKDEHPQ